jgi:EAL domain-containing protein (putative c-di-GMP-specific phosphodiesterase class I)
MIHDVQSVLIVEDSKAQRTLLEMMCVDLNIPKILIAKNGRKALDLLETEQNIDLLLCDLELPEIDGIEMINLIAKKRKNFALVVMSGREQSLISAVELMAKSEGLYTLGAIKKPLSENVLRSVLEKFNRQSLTNISAPKQSITKQIQASDLLEALKQDQLSLYFQPKVQFKTDELVGVEALLRWRHPIHGMISPAEFIPLAIKYQLIDTLTLWVIDKAILTLKNWQNQQINLSISINLSAKSFENPAFASQILERLQQHKINPKNLIFEVTETEVINDIGAALCLLTKLRLAGFGLSIDDYGTGQSSVRQLTQIPFTELKMDRMLIDGIHGKDHLKVIFESTQRMCHKLDIQIVAEGIEKIEEWNYLTQADCDLAQGFLICPPVTV